MSSLEYAADAAAAGARALLVLPAGPEDTGGISPEQEERLLEIVRGAGLRMVGPGSLGGPQHGCRGQFNATFSGASVSAGAWRLARTRSRRLGLLGHAAARQLGVSLFVSLGDRADVSTNDLLEWCEDDERTAAVMLYLHTFGDPQRFIRVAQRVAREKPILALTSSSCSSTLIL